MFVVKALIVSIVGGVFAYFYFNGVFARAVRRGRLTADGLIPGLDGLAYVLLFVFLSIVAALFSFALMFLNSPIIGSMIAAAVSVMLLTPLVKEYFSDAKRGHGSGARESSDSAANRTGTANSARLFLIINVFILFQLISLIVWFLKGLDFNF